MNENELNAALAQVREWLLHSSNIDELQNKLHQLEDLTERSA